MLADWGQRSPRWAGVRSELVDVCGTSVHVLRADGPPDATPLLLVHGLGGSATNWLEVLRPLSRVGPVLAPDLPGFGRTEPPARRAPRVEANTRFLRALLDAVGWDRAVVVGNSMGGTMAVLLAAREPDRAERLVLVAPALPAPLRHLPQLPKETFRRFAPFLVPGLGRTVLRRMWGRMSPEELWVDSAAFVHGDPGRVSVELREVGIEGLRHGREHDWRLHGLAVAAESVVGAVTTRRLLLRAIDAVAVPTLVIWGAKDRLVGRPVIDGLVQRRADLELRVLEGVGHVPQIEAPDAFVEVARRWLTDGGRRASTAVGPGDLVLPA